MLQFFKKLFGLKTDQEKNTDDIRNKFLDETRKREQEKQKYDIKIEKIENFHTTNINQNIDDDDEFYNEYSEDYIVDCTINGEFTKYFVFEMNKVFNYETMISPKDLLFVDCLLEKIWNKIEEKQIEQDNNKYTKLMNDYKNQLNKTVQTLDPIISDIEVNPVTKENEVTKRIVMKAVEKEKKIIQDISSKEEKEEEDKEPSVVSSKKKGGRPKKETK